MREEAGNRGRPVPEAVGLEGGGDPTSTGVSRKLTERQELYNGFGNGLALAFELALTPGIFGLMGYGLDRWLDTLPVFTIILVLVCIVGLSARQFYGYDAQMKVHEAAGPWARKPVVETQPLPETAPPQTPPPDAQAGPERAGER